jgi:hypothetical protein
MAEERVIVCPDCESQVLESYYAQHQKFGCASSGEKSNSKSGSTKKSEPKRKPRRRKKKKPQLVLVSKRGMRIPSKTECSLCHKAKSPVWHYAKSSRGPVNICGDCKPRLFDRSFGKKDALNYAETGGLYEGNRRKH